MITDATHPLSTKTVIVELPNTDWVARHHSCVPLYYHGPDMPDGAPFDPSAQEPLP